MSDTEQQSDEDLAAAWGAEAEGEPAQPERVLNQAEIDNLLGFNDGPAGDESRSGMQRIISSGLVSYERLPMLEIVFDRLVRIMSTSLRNFTSDNVEVSLDNITSLRFGDYLNSIPLPAMLAVFKAEEWDNFGLMTVDSSMIYSIVDVLLGGRRGTAVGSINGKFMGTCSSEHSVFSSLFCTFHRTRIICRFLRCFRSVQRHPVRYR